MYSLFSFPPLLALFKSLAAIPANETTSVIITATTMATAMPTISRLLVVKNATSRAKDVRTVVEAPEVCTIMRESKLTLG